MNYQKPNIILAVMLLAATGVAAWFIGPALAGMPMNAAAAHPMWFAALTLAVVTAGMTLRNEGRANAQQSANIESAAAGAGALLLLLVALLGEGYLVKKGLWEGSHSVAAEGVPDFGSRAPWDVADATAKRSLGDQVGRAGKVRYAAGGAHGTWSVLVERRGFATGYESVTELTIAANGSGLAKRETCQFAPKAMLKADGIWPRNNLRREVRKTAGWRTFYDANDVTGYCDGKTPIVAVPVMRLSGFPAHRVPAGVVLYNGTTGELDFREDVEEGTVPVPVYPKSLAADQEDASHTKDGYMAYLFRRAGWEDTSKDGASPNSENPSEFVLPVKGGGQSIVTPLTPRGSSSSVVALAYVDGGSVQAGKLNSYNIYKYENARPAISTSEASIRAEYADLPWASGIRVYEVVPTSDPKKWKASLGQGQKVQYQVTISEDGTVSLIGSGAAREPLKDKKGRKVSNIDLSDLSDEELAALLGEAQKRLEERAAKK